VTPDVLQPVLVLQPGSAEPSWYWQGAMLQVMAYTSDALRKAAGLDYAEARQPIVWEVAHGARINDALMPLLSHVKDTVGVETGVHYACWAEDVAYSEGGRGFALDGLGRGPGGVAVVGLGNLHKIVASALPYPHRHYAFTMVHELLHCFNLRDTAHWPSNELHDRTMTDAQAWGAFSRWEWNGTTGLLPLEIATLRARGGLVPWRGAPPPTPAVIADTVPTLAPAAGPQVAAAAPELAALVEEADKALDVAFFDLEVAGVAFARLRAALVKEGLI
jgi:hypothetical protein